MQVTLEEVLVLCVYDVLAIFDDRPRTIVLTGVFHMCINPSLRRHTYRMIVNRRQIHTLCSHAPCKACDHRVTVAHPIYRCLPPTVFDKPLTNGVSLSVVHAATKHRISNMLHVAGVKLVGLSLMNSTQPLAERTLNARTPENKPLTKANSVCSVYIHTDQYAKPICV